MKKSKFTEQQICFALHQADTGTHVEEVCRKMGISQATFYNWKKKYSGLGSSELRRLRRLEEENQQLKKCNDPAFFAHIKRHIYKMHLGFSFPVLGVVCGCCNACTTDLKYALHPARIQSDVKTHTVL